MKGGRIVGSSTGKNIGAVNPQTKTFFNEQPKGLNLSMNYTKQANDPVFTFKTSPRVPASTKAYNKINGISAFNQ